MTKISHLPAFICFVFVVTFHNWSKNRHPSSFFLHTIRKIGEFGVTWYIIWQYSPRLTKNKGDRVPVFWMDCCGCNIFKLNTYVGKKQSDTKLKSSKFLANDTSTSGEIIGCSRHWRTTNLQGTVDSVTQAESKHFWNHLPSRHLCPWYSHTNKVKKQGLMIQW